MLSTRGTTYCLFAYICSYTSLPLSVMLVPGERGEALTNTTVSTDYGNSSTQPDRELDPMYRLRDRRLCPDDPCTREGT